MYTETIYHLTAGNPNRNSVAMQLADNAYACFHCLDSYREVSSMSAAWRKQFSHFVVVGMGGSINAGLTYAALGKDNITFIDNIEPESTADLIDTLPDPRHTLLIYISKSGKTEEVLLLYKLLYTKWHAVLGNDAANHTLIISQEHDSPLTTIAKQSKHHFIPHDPDIGGRFSYLSVVGLLIAGLVGLDIGAIAQGAQQALTDYCLGSAKRDQFCHALASGLQDQSHQANVVLTYHDRLLPFQIWFQQLWAESLGKKGMGSIPVAFSGTRDQHSQLQLYLANPTGKAFTLIRCAHYDSAYPALTQAYKAHAETVSYSLRQTGQITRVITLPQLDSYYLAYIMTNMVLDTLITAAYADIDPFGQNQVEHVKKAHNPRIEALTTNLS